MGFTHVGGVIATSSNSNVTTKAIVLGAAPSLGNLVIVGIVWYGPTAHPTGVTVSDNNGNAYTLTTSSPYGTTSGSIVNPTLAIAYRLSAPSNASATININWTTANAIDAWADVFTVSGGTVVYDTDGIGDPGTSSSNINAPTLTPARPNALLYATAVSGGDISSP